MCRGLNRINIVRLSPSGIGQNVKNTMRFLASNFSKTLISPREKRLYFVHGNKEFSAGT